MPSLKLAPSRYSIGQLARMFGMTHRAIRFYEQIGLLEPGRNGQQRDYRRRDYQRLAVIARARKAGLKLEHIRELLDLYDPADHGEAQVSKAIERLRQRVEDLDAQRDCVMEQLSELQAQLQRQQAAAPREALRSTG